MKKFILFLLLFCFSIGITAQTYKYRATQYAYKTTNRYGVWSNWSDWQNVSILVVVSLDREKINIYSQTTQEYDIYDAGNDWVSDNEGGRTWTLKCVNADGLRCEVRLRSQRDSQLQLYVDFSDMMWVYNIEQK